MSMVQVVVGSQEWKLLKWLINCLQLWNDEKIGYCTLYLMLNFYNYNNCQITFNFNFKFLKVFLNYIFLW